MDIVALLVSALMAVAAPTGVVVDTLATDALRRQVAEVEDLSVRIDNVPNYPVIQGRIDPIWVAARGVYLRQLPALRIAALDLETDPLALDLGSLRRGKLSLNAPAQAALRMRIQEEDINAFLGSSQVQAWLEDLQFNLPGETADRAQRRYGLANPQVNLLANNRLWIGVDLEDRVLEATLPITLETGIVMANGHQIDLIDPHLEIEGEAVPLALVSPLAAGALEAFSLRRLEAWGLTSRVLALAIHDHELDLAIFARLDPDSPFLQR